MITKLVSAKWTEMIAFEWGDDRGLTSGGRSTGHTTSSFHPVDDFERSVRSGVSNNRPCSPVDLLCDEEERLQNSSHRPVRE